VEEEQARTQRLLLNILPEEVAEELKRRVMPEPTSSSR